MNSRVQYRSLYGCHAFFHQRTLSKGVRNKVVFYDTAQFGKGQIDTSEDFLEPAYPYHLYV